jgi:hypothetical protein
MDLAGDQVIDVIVWSIAGLSVSVAARRHQASPR